MSPRFVVVVIIAFLGLELISIVLVADWLGAFATLMAIAAGMVLGVLMLRRAGFQVARAALASGGVLDLSRVGGTGRMVGAALLLAMPGFLSDVVALGLLIAPRRPAPAAAPSGTRRRGRPRARRVSPHAGAAPSGGFARGMSVLPARPTPPPASDTAS